jgi:dihydropteroate synthase
MARIIKGRENRLIEFRRMEMMGIINVTPDSFFADSRAAGAEEALAKAELQIAEGARLIDIGGESTRPGSKPVDAEEEIRRICPVIRKLREKHPEIMISADTYRAETAFAAIESGADMINDISGLTFEPEIADVIAKAGAAAVIMHTGGRPENMQDRPEYSDVVEDVFAFLKKQTAFAEQRGIGPDQIMIDVGIGFGKTCEQNLQLMNNLEIMNRTGAHITSKTADGLTDGTGEAVKKSFPWLLGTSRKSMIGLTLELPADQRLEGTLVTTVFGVAAGCSFIRVHDVKENLRAVKMTRVILGAQ